MTPARDDEHPLKGRWRPARPYVWGGHVSPQFVLILLIVHAAVLGWFASSWDHVRLVMYSFTEVPSEYEVNDAPEDLALSFGYREDAIDELLVFRLIAEPLVKDASTATERARRLADYIYSLRKPEMDVFDEDQRYGPEVLLERMQQGYAANCGQMSTVLASFWRSLGGHSRAVRWGTPQGELGHYALELWDADRQRWFYYDMNLNGYLHDDDGVTPLSVAGVRSSLLTGEDVHPTSNPDAHDYTIEDLMAVVRSYPVESYVLNNDYRRWSPDRRFGLFNRYYAALAALPHPVDRVVDNLTGSRDRRLIVRGRVLVAGRMSFTTARIFVAYLVVMIAVCLVTLRRTGSGRRAGRIPPTAADTPPSR